MRLIDADTLIKNLSYLYTKNHIPVDMRAKEILTTIREQPTAYDVDKVVEELEECSWSFEAKILVPHSNELGEYEEEVERKMIFTQDAIKIVKAGGENV